MNLAYRDVRRHLWRYLGTSLGLGMLFTVVLAMGGIYNGLVADATALARLMDTDLWVVQRDTWGPFADTSQLDPSTEDRVAAVAGVASARSYTYQAIQREHDGKALRLALVGLAWPEDHGENLPLAAGRPLQQAHGEMIVDASLGLPIGERIHLGTETYTVVGVTRQALTTGGDSVGFLTVADAHLVVADRPPDAMISERQRRLERLRLTDLGRGQPALEELAVDPSWRPPALAPALISAVLVRVEAPHRMQEVQRALAAWPDVAVYTQEEQERLLLHGVVRKARAQLGMFSAILTLTAAVLVAMVVYNLTLEKTHDIAILKLMGASTGRLGVMVLQEAWVLGGLAYLIALVIGHYAFPHFARRIVLTPTLLQAAPLLVLFVTTAASGLGIFYALRVDASKALEG